MKNKNKIKENKPEEKKFKVDRNKGEMKFFHVFHLAHFSFSRTFHGIPTLKNLVDSRCMFYPAQEFRSMFCIPFQ